MRQGAVSIGEGGAVGNREWNEEASMRGGGAERAVEALAATMLDSMHTTEGFRASSKIEDNCSIK